MPFPESDRVKFNKNPLRQVICQLRFPPILKIDTDIPADFQENIRGLFPNFSETTELRLEIPRITSGSVPLDFFDQKPQPIGNKNYSFTTVDEKYKVNLTRTFISLSTFNYSVWEDFRRILKKVIKVFSDSYETPYYSRIGLRYIDIIVRSELNLVNEDWDHLLQPYILGILSEPHVGRNVEDYEGRYLIRLDDGNSTVRIITKLIQNDAKNENLFVIDSDLFNDKRILLKDVKKRLDYLNTRASRLINWAILPQLYQAMEPENI
jgi:uncharacterized protein (TIGR04255 family)